MAQGVCVILNSAEREQLAAMVADRNRARIVLASADRGSAQQVAQSIGVSRPTVWRWQTRFAETGVEGLLRDKTRKPGKAPIAAETTARVVALTCTEPPHQATHWNRPGGGQDNRHLAEFGAAHLAGAQCSRTACAPSSARAIPALPPS
jgi:Homeodomain-like domain-containing protein